MLSLGACGGASAGEPSRAAVFDILACRHSTAAPDGERFRVAIDDPNVIAQADARIGRGPGLILSGRLAAGDGGFNAPWTWHLDPGTVAFGQVATEACDGCPSFVEANLTYWLRYGSFCPWSTEVVGRVS